MFQVLVSGNTKTITGPSISLIASSSASPSIAVVAIPGRPEAGIESIHLPVIRQESVFVDIVLFEMVLALALSLVLGGVVRHRPS